MRTGQLCGLGLGPGDPELVTLKAVRLLRAAAIVAYSAPQSGPSFARSIVAEFLDRGQPEIALRFPMRPGPVPEELYEAAAGQLAAVLDAGDDVALLCQGDPLLYGSFSGILQRLAPRYRVLVVPGVSSTTACAAAAGLPLVRRDESFTIIPATLPEKQLMHRLAAAESAAIIKLGRHAAKLRRVLSELGVLDRAIYVERATLPNQRVMPFAAVAPATVPYFAMVLLRRESGL